MKNKNPKNKIIKTSHNLPYARILFIIKEARIGLKAHEVKPAFSETTSFRIRNSLAKIFSLRSYL